MGWDAPWHWIVLAIVVIALFGYKKLPDAARSLGRSLRIFKTEIKGMSEDDAARAAAKSEAIVPPPTPASVPSPPVPSPPLPEAPVELATGVAPSPVQQPRPTE